MRQYIYGINIGVLGSWQLGLAAVAVTDDADFDLDNIWYFMIVVWHLVFDISEFCWSCIVNDWFPIMELFLYAEHVMFDR